MGRRVGLFARDGAGACAGSCSQMVGASHDEDLSSPFPLPPSLLLFDFVVLDPTLRAPSHTRILLAKFSAASAWDRHPEPVDHPPSHEPDGLLFDNFLFPPLWSLPSSFLEPHQPSKDGLDMDVAQPWPVDQPRSDDEPPSLYTGEDESFGEGPCPSLPPPLPDLPDLSALAPLFPELPGRSSMDVMLDEDPLQLGLLQPCQTER